MKRLKASAAAGLALLVSACAAKMSDAPDETLQVARGWQVLGACVYQSALKSYPASMLNYSEVAPSQQSVLAFHNEAGDQNFIIRIQGAGSGSTVTIWSSYTVPDVVTLGTQARALVTGCSG